MKPPLKKALVACVTVSASAAVGFGYLYRIPTSVDVDLQTRTFSFVLVRNGNATITLEGARQVRLKNARGASVIVDQGRNQTRAIALANGDVDLTKANESEPPRPQESSGTRVRGDFEVPSGSRVLLATSDESSHDVRLRVGSTGAKVVLKAKGNIVVQSSPESSDSPSRTKAYGRGERWTELRAARAESVFLMGAIASSVAMPATFGDSLREISFDEPALEVGPGSGELSQAFRTSIVSGKIVYPDLDKFDPVMLTEDDSIEMVPDQKGFRLESIRGLASGEKDEGFHVRLTGVAIALRSGSSHHLVDRRTTYATLYRVGPWPGIVAAIVVIVAWAKKFFDPAKVEPTPATPASTSTQ